MEDDVLSRIFTGIYSFIIIFTFFGCVFALFLFYYERKHRKIAHNFVISLVLGDIVHGCIGSTICIRFCNGSKVGDSTCHIEHAILMATVYISLMNVLTTAIDRFWAILFPLHYHANMSNKISYGKLSSIKYVTIKERKSSQETATYLTDYTLSCLNIQNLILQYCSSVLIASGWIIGTGLGCGIIGMRSNKYREFGNEKCIYLGLVVEPIYLFAYIELIMYVTVTVTVLLYIAIYMTMRKMFQANIGRNNIRSIIDWVNEQKRPKEEGKVIGFLKVREVRVTLLLFVTIITFVCCLIPVLFVVQLYSTTPDAGYGKILITYSLPKIYSMINPIFYAYTIENIRKAFKTFIATICCKPVESSRNAYFPSKGASGKMALHNMEKFIE